MAFFTSIGLAIGASAASAAAAGAAVTATAVGVIGAGLSVYGQMQQAETAKAMGKYNAKLAENQALQTEMDAHENIRRQRSQNERLLATQRSRFAKAGVVEEGTPLELLAETAGTLELATLDYSRQQSQQATSLRAQGAADRAMGANQARAAYIGAGASLLSGIGSAAGGAYQLNQAGAFNSANPNTMAGMAAASAPASLAVRSGY
jgi:hypothetical protein